jgi:hypothetical protein
MCDKTCGKRSEAHLGEVTSPKLGLISDIESELESIVDNMRDIVEDKGEVDPNLSSLAVKLLLIARDLKNLKSKPSEQTTVDSKARALDAFEGALSDLASEIKENESSGAGISAGAYIDDLLDIIREIQKLIKTPSDHQTLPCLGNSSMFNNLYVNNKPIANKAEKEQAENIRDLQDVVDEIESELDESKKLNEALLTLVKSLLKDQDE